MNDQTIWARACPKYPELSVSVSRTAIGTYRVVFRDHDAGAVIESRVFNSCARATEHAHNLLDQA